MTDGSTVVEVAALSCFMDEARNHSAFAAVSFAARAGMVVGVTGPSGAGKTSLLLAIGGLLEFGFPGARLEGKLVVTDGDGERLPQAKVSLVTENPYAQTTGLKTIVREELAVPLEMRGVEREEMKQRCQRIVDDVGIWRRFDGRLDVLSGGELARTQIGAGMISNPQLLLLDGVFGELDPGFRRECVDLVREFVRRRLGIAFFGFYPGEAEESWFDLLIPLGSKYATAERVVASDEHRREDVAHLALGQWQDRRERIIEAEDLWFRYEREGEWILRGISFKLGAADGAFLVGQNGSGKTTLFRIIVGLLFPVKGSVWLSPEVTGAEPGKLKSGIGYALQNPDLYFCSGSVREELDLVPEATRDWASGWADRMGLGLHLDDNPFDLPRGLRKRLTVLLAAASSRQLLLLDEPTQYQDEQGVLTVAQLVRSLLSAGKTLICCTHDGRLLEELGTLRVLALASGKLEVREHR